MSRPRREFQPGSLELEGRALLSAGLVGPLHPAGTYSVGFSGPPQVVLQPDGPVTLNLVYSGFRRPDDPVPPPVRVRVDADPSSPAVGAVHQVVTLVWGGPEPTVTIPIIPGAPNPGVVDVTLTLTPLDAPDVQADPPLHLKVLASKDLLPTSIADTRVTPQGVVLTFSKPVDPAGASNVKSFP